MKRTHATISSNRIPYYTLLGLLVLSFLTGGGSRADIQSLTILRPAAFFCLSVGLLYWSWEKGRPFRFLLMMLLLSVGLTAVHLIPLPASIWQSMPGRGLVSQIDTAVGLGTIMRPLSLVSTATWNALYSLVIPAAILFLGIALSNAQRQSLLIWIIGIGMISGILGVFQAIGPDDGPFYLYRITSTGSAVGLFANRNHNAVFLASILPMLTVYAGTETSKSRKNKRNGVDQQVLFRQIFCLACAALLMPMILLTGSRAGMVLGALALFFAPFMFRLARSTSGNANSSPSRNRWLYIAAGIAFAMLISLTVMMSRAKGLDRLLAMETVDDLRSDIWRVSIELFHTFFPFGSGIGSFVPAFKVAEPTAMLQTSYINHVHNDWLELAITGGLPAIILMAIGVAGWLWQLITCWKDSNRGKTRIFAILGGFISVMLLAASVVDYPLRTPAMLALFIIAMLWFFEDNDRKSTDDSR